MGLKKLLFLAVLLGLFAYGRAEEEAANDDAAEADDDDADEEEVSTEGTQQFSEEDLEKMDASGKKFEFQAEVTRLMEIIIHSLYTQRDIFLRELISNSGDAIDKIRYRSLLDKDILGDTTELEIKLRADEESNTLTITDTGIGMTAAELEANLGTVARSGTAQFLDAFNKKKEEGDGNNALNLIGQFGVGFYSAFLVADELTVVSKHPESETQNIWRSKADGSFIVTEDPRGNTLGRGTSVVLTLKEDAGEFLDNSELERVVKRYSQFLQYPIKLWKSKTEMVDVEPEAKDEDEAEKEDEDGDDDDEELTAEDEDDEDEPEEPAKQVEKTVWYWDQLNDQKPIWTRRPSQIEEEEYQSFYRSFSKGDDDYLAKSHFRAEGEIEFDSILFVPKTAPYGLYDNYYTQKSSLSLFVRRVLVADKFEDFIPRYLNFMKGLVDSNDLPLNVNREQLQKNKIMKVISKKVTRKALDMLKKMAQEEEDDDEDEDSEDEDEDEDTEAEDEDDDEDEKSTVYTDFYKEFGRSIKLGVIEDTKNRKKLVNLLRFKTVQNPDQAISLQKYVAEMSEGQKNIYYISAGSLEEAKASPFLERAKAKGYDVLYFVENLDEYLNLSEFEDYTLQSVTKEGLDLGDGKGGEKYLKSMQEEFTVLTDWLKDLYGSNVNKVEVSPRLQTSPLIIATTKYGHSANMERITRGQAFGKTSGRASKVVEINPRHPIMKKMKDAVSKDKEDEEMKNYAQVLYYMALVQSGFSIEADDVPKYSSFLENVVREGMSIDKDAKADAMPTFGDEADDEGEDEDEDEDDEEDGDEEELEDDDEEEDGEAAEAAEESKDEL